MRRIEKGELLSLTNYFRVVKHDVQEDFLVVEEVLNKNKESLIQIHGSDLLETLVSADYYESTVKLTKSELVNVLLSAGNNIFTINFTKQDGVIRTLKGTSPVAEINLGRTQVKDLEVLEKNPEDKTRGIRLVDNRTINFIVLNKVMYISK